MLNFIFSFLELFLSHSLYYMIIELYLYIELSIITLF